MMVRAVRDMAAPCVVFVTEGRWITFDQLSAQLRRAGVRTITLHTRESGLGRIARRLLYDEDHLTDNSHLGIRLGQIVTRNNVVDIQFEEATYLAVDEVLPFLAPEVASSLRQRLVIIDKLRASHLFHDAGIETPRTIAASASNVEGVATALGFPLVMKSRIGSSGTSVAIIEDQATLRAKFPADEVAIADTYFEQFVNGEKLNYGASVTAQRLRQEVCYQVVRWRGAVGTAIEVMTIHDDTLGDVGRRAVTVAGCSGLLNIDVIRDEHGKYWIIDFNARSFGGATCFRRAGVNFANGYLESLGQLPPSSSTQSAVTNLRLRVFPGEFQDLVGVKGVARELSAYAVESLRYFRWIGFRYWLAEDIFAVNALTTFLSQRRRRQ